MEAKIKLTKTVAANIVQTRYDDLPREAREATKRSILDTLAVMLPPSTLDKACIALAEIAKEAGGKKESTLIGFGGKVPCWMAALVNGSLSHALDYDDITDRPVYHPTACSFPAALAIAERIRGVSGKAFITAVALGNDLGIRLASAPRGSLLDDYPWFPATTFGVFSTTAAAGKLLGLSEEEMINALGMALHRVFGVTEAMDAPDSDMRAIRDGFTNKEGVLSALMAAKGIAACKDAIEKLFEFFYRNNYDAQAVTLNLGKRFRGVEAGLKVWPSCRPTNGCIQGALEIVKKNGITPDQIKEVTLTVSAFAGNHLCEPTKAKQEPKQSIDAKFSLPFSVGVALTKGNVEIAHFLPESLHDHEVLQMAKRVRYQIDPTFATITPVVVDIRTRDGKLFSERVELLYGHPQNPLSNEDLIAKFKKCGQYTRKPLAAENTEQLIGMILKLEEVSDIREITDLLL